MAESEQEKKNRRVAMITTAGVSGLVLLLMILIAAWRAPDPPLPEYGIELNFGTDDQGSGAVQPVTPVGSPESQQQEVQQSQPEESKPEPPTETKVEESQPEPAETKPVEQPITSKIESPVVVKEEKKEEPKPVEKPKEEKPVEKPAEKPVEKKVEPKEDPKPIATYNPNAAKTDNASTDKAGQPGSHGDDANKAGDKGSPQGTLNPNASFKGTPGGGAGGSSLDLAGWQWDSRPAPKVPDSELGGVVKFEIKVDDRGDIVSIRTLERSVSLETEQVCKQAIQKLTFTKTGSNVPSISTGTITFVIRSK